MFLVLFSNMKHDKQKVSSPFVVLSKLFPQFFFRTLKTKFRVSSSNILEPPHSLYWLGTSKLKENGGMLHDFGRDCSTNDPKRLKLRKPGFLHFETHDGDWCCFCCSGWRRCDSEDFTETLHAQLDESVCTAHPDPQWQAVQSHSHVREVWWCSWWL